MTRWEQEWHCDWSWFQACLMYKSKNDPTIYIVIVVYWYFVFYFQPRHDMRYILEGAGEYKGVLGVFPDVMCVHKVSNMEQTGVLGGLKISPIMAPFNRGQ